MYIKIFLALNGETSQKTTNSTLAVCLMLIPFLQDIMYVISSLLPEVWLLNYFNAINITRDR